MEAQGGQSFNSYHCCVLHKTPFLTLISKVLTLVTKVLTLVSKVLILTCCASFNKYSFMPNRLLVTRSAALVQRMNSFRLGTSPRHTHNSPRHAQVIITHISFQAVTSHVHISEEAPEIFTSPTYKSSKVWSRSKRDGGPSRSP